MGSYLIRRLFIGIPAVVLISFLSFVVITLPPGDFGSSLEQQLIRIGGMSREQAASVANQLRVKYGLDKPLIVQYGKWLINLLRGNLGYSLRYRRPVEEVILPRLGWTVAISGAALVFSVLLGSTLGIYSATHQYNVLDYVFSIFSFVGLSVPGFFFALCLLYIFIFLLGFKSIGGLFSSDMVLQPWSWAKFVDFISHFWVPVVIVGINGTAWYVRAMRANLLDVLGAPYIQVAQAKGLTSRAVIYRHALRNALHPLIMHIGMSLPWLIQGEIATSIVLGLPTMGPMLLTALQDQDMQLAGGFLFILAVLMVVCNLMADFCLAVVDPRIRYE
ncbi:MAG: ABC transporter permease [Candidatus Methanomethyliaceae archaeon]